MPPIDAGGYGQELGGDPAGDADRTTVDDADGGLDGPDSQTQVEDDTGGGEERRLRRDAQSDPMADQTEPVQSEPTAGEQFGDELGGDPAEGGGVSEPTPEDTDDAVVTDDGKIDVDRTTTVSEADSTSGRVDAGRFGQELGGDPAGDAGRTPPPTPDDVTDPGPAVPEQGIEEGGATPEVEQQAQDFEQSIVQSTPGVTEEDVSVSLVGTGEGVVLRATFTEGAEARVQDQLLSARRDVVTSAQDDPGVRDAVVGVGGGDLLEPTRTARREALAELREAVEEDIEGQVGAVRTERAGISNPTLRENVVGNVDLEPGEDFTLDLSEELTDEGTRFSVDVELTETFEQAEAERAFGLDLRNQFGVELEAGKEFRAVQTDEGGYEAEITEAGEETIRHEQPEQFGDIDWSAVFGIDTAPADLTDQDVSRADLRAAGVDPATVLRPTGDSDVDEVEVALSDASAAIAGAGRNFASSLFDEGGVASESIIAANLRTSPLDLTDQDVSERDLRAAGIDAATVRREADEGGAESFEENLRGFGRGLAQAPFALGNVPALAGAVLEGVEYGQYATQRDLGTTYRQTEDRAIEVGEAAYQEVTERPAEFAGLAVGTLGASYGIMRAAAGVGPRTGLAARYAIQPGEELAGTVGYRITSRVASPRRAQQLFPNREPLIFSEEAAIRTARRFHSGLRPRVAAARGRTADIAFGKAETRVARSGPSEISGFEESRLVTERPGARSQLQAGVSRARDAFSGRAFAGVPIARQTELETQGRQPSVEAETETLLDELEGPLTRMERAQESRARGRRRRVESRFDVEENPLRSRAREGRLLAEAETDAGALRRLEMAGQPELQDVAADVDTMQLQSPLADTVQLDAEIERGDVLQDVETETDLEQELELDTEFDSPLDLELELEAEAEGETELELEFEFEMETEVEMEPFGDRGDRRDEEDPFRTFGESRELLERDLLNPFTGR